MLIKHSQPAINNKEEKALLKVLRSGHLAEGKEVASFERGIAQVTGTPYAAVVSSGSAAFVLLLRAIGIGPGDEVILPSFACSTFLSSVQSVGAVPRLVDSSCDTFNMNCELLTVTKKSRLIVAIHQFGLPAPILELKKFGLPVIEAGAHAIGGYIGKKSIGSVGDAAFFSFYATKLITTGEGGAVVSNNRGWVSKIMDLRQYDEKKDCCVRYNYKMTDLAASIGLAQLKKLSGFLKKREQLAKRYTSSLKNIPGIILPVDIPGRVWFRYVILCKSNRLREYLLQHLNRVGIEAKVPLFSPLHRYLNLQDRAFPETTLAWKRILSLPIYPALTVGEAEKITKKIKELLVEDPGESAKGRSRQRRYR